MIVWGILDLIAPVNPPLVNLELARLGFGLTHEADWSANIAYFL